MTIKNELHHGLHLDTLAIHAGQAPDPQTGAVMTAIQLSSTFAQQGPGNHLGYEYSRTNNPTRHTLEMCVAALEGGQHGIAFASGSAATSALLSTLLPGDHVICADDVYGGTYRQLNAVYAPLGIEVTRVDMTELRHVEAALRPTTKLLWCETPTNPLLKLADIKALAWLSGTHGSRLIVDNTFATPMSQRPLLLGAHAVVHSTTKYLNGHSDVVGGMVVADDEELVRKLRFLQNAVGAVPSPFDCYLVLRGLKTLPVRMRRHTETALSLAIFLDAHPRVKKVFYPGLPTHPQRMLATKQMALAGGMITCELHGGLAAAQHVLSSTQLFTCAESLGGVESLIEHPASMTHASLPAVARDALGITAGLIRLSVGLEAEEDLRADLEAALA